MYARHVRRDRRRPTQLFARPAPPVHARAAAERAAARPAPAGAAAADQGVAARHARRSRAACPFAPRCATPVDDLREELPPLSRSSRARPRRRVLQPGAGGDECGGQLTAARATIASRRDAARRGRATSRSTSRSRAASCSTGTSATCVRSTASRSRSGAARRSASSASPAAASRRVGRAILRLYEPTGGRIVFDGAGRHGARRGRAAAAAAPDADGLPGPVRVAQPAAHRGRIVGEPLRTHGLARRRATAGARPRAARDRRPAARRGDALPARVLRRPAAAHRHRARARGQPRLDRRRRARLGARRVDPGADPQPARGAAGGVRADLPVHRARPRRRPAHLRPRSRSCTSARIVEVAAADELYERPLHPYTISLLSAVPIPDPVVERQRERDPARTATCRARRTRRAAAASTRAARTCSRRAAGTRSRRCARWRARPPGRLPLGRGDRGGQTRAEDRRPGKRGRRRGPA